MNFYWIFTDHHDHVEDDDNTDKASTDQESSCHLASLLIQSHLVDDKVGGCARCDRHKEVGG